MDYIKRFFTPQVILTLAIIVVLIERATSSWLGVLAGAEIWICSLALVAATAIGVHNSRSTALQKKQIADAIGHLARGEIEADLRLSAGSSSIDDAVLSLQQKLIESRDQDLANQLQINLLRQSLDDMQVASMTVDTNGKIVFVNNSLLELLANTQDEIRKDIEDFSWNTILHKDIVLFDKDLDLQSVSATEIKLGEERFKLLINPLLDADQNVLGSVIVWQDRTEEHAFEIDMETILNNAVQGDLSQRVDVSQQTGFSHTAAVSVNKLLSLAESIILDTVRVFGAMAKGELNQTIDEEYEGSFDRLKQDANTTVSRLKEVVSGIQQSSEAVTTAFKEINQGNANLSQRTEEQASSLEETASSMEEMTSTVQKNSENAQKANELALKARQEAEKGGEVVGLAVKAMAEINEASKGISDIISVIDEIAFQTNLLALNASVEAARAGEQGRGFAVVAGEVRNLAGRSAEAAKEIKSLIQDSGSKVAKGSSLVDESGQTLESIVLQVKDVARIVEEISSASLEQAAGIAQVSTTISQMDDMTQQNAALVEEVSAASEIASEQAVNLADMISFFSSSDTSLKAFTAKTAPANTPRYEPAAVKSRPPAAAASNSGSDSVWEEF